ncbi:hypothetical protein KCP75_17515 [Salmonella enterica subsp. enterica]|nr:hypothetical protein KCP75_17515 [Salmonella enterica subsp. enterica]
MLVAFSCCASQSAVAALLAALAAVDGGNRPLMRWFEQLSAAYTMALYPTVPGDFAALFGGRDFAAATDHIFAGRYLGRLAGRVSWKSEIDAGFFWSAMQNAADRAYGPR